MKSSIKVLMILGIISCLLGAGMMTAGAMMGGGDDLEELFYPYIRQYSYRYSDESQISVAAEESMAFPDIRELKITVIGDSCIEVIETGAEYLPENTIQVARAGTDDALSYQLDVNGDTLDIHLPREWREYLNNNHRGVEDLAIYIPQNYQFRSVEIECISGELAADAIYTREMSVENVSGLVTIQGGRIEDMDIECTTGTIECYALISREADVDCISGDIDIMMADSFESYDYEWEVLSGTIIADDQTLDGGIVGKGKKKMDHHTGRKVELDCVSGTITVNYANGS
ncbi:MAG: DUF4097 family beta strand repeat-containing protein [Lachnospiraceae bacterium]